MELTTGITVVAMVHNRHDDRIQRFITFLTRQFVLPYEVIVIDTSLNATNQDFSQRVCQNITHISAPGDTINKAYAYNLALRQVESEYTLFTDIDILFHPDFLAKIAEMFKGNPQYFIQAVTTYLPPATQTDDWIELLSLAKHYGKEVSHRLSPGACQAALTSWFKSVHGYDERFVNLGGMDDDMMVRARKANLDCIWIDEIMTLHQWHEKSKLKGMDGKLFNADPSVIVKQEWGTWV